MQALRYTTFSCTRFPIFAQKLRFHPFFSLCTPENRSAPLQPPCPGEFIGLAISLSHRRTQATRRLPSNIPRSKKLTTPSRFTSKDGGGSELTNSILLLQIIHFFSRYIKINLSLATHIRAPSANKTAQSPYLRTVSLECRGFCLP